MLWLSSCVLASPNKSGIFVKFSVSRKIRTSLIRSWGAEQTRMSGNTRLRSDYRPYTAQYFFRHLGSSSPIPRFGENITQIRRLSSINTDM